MEGITNNHLLIFLGILAVIIELLMGVATGFDLLLIGIIFIIGGVIGIVVDSFSIALGVIAVLSFVYVFIGRKMIKKELGITTKATNVDALIGGKGIVIKQITPQKPGQVKIEGEIWRAQSNQTIDEGVSVTVESVSGVTLQVRIRN